jgi:Zn-dependent protease
MSDFSAWSLYVGRWHRVAVRVHLLLVVVGVFAVFLATSEPGYGLLATAILLASALVHESGRAFAAVRLGGTCEQIVVGPLGGLVSPEVPRERSAELITAVAGPAVNLGVVLVTLPILIAAGIEVAPLVSLLAPAGLGTGELWEVALKQVFWINGMLVVANMLPAFPLAGARALRSMLWPSLDYRVAGHVVARASKLTALGLCILAWLVAGDMLAGVLPTWLPLILVATWLFGMAQQESMRLDESEWDEELFNYDFSQGYTSLERNFESPRRSGSSVRRWLQNRSELRRRRREAREHEEERKVDEILIRLHETGMESLSAKERALLNRVSARYRNRQSN